MKRTILNDVLSPSPPDALYHYTTQAGLLGIVQEKAIWATHTQYLNDNREYVHALQMVMDEIAAMLKETSDGTARSFLIDMQGCIEGIESVNVCVCCFSEVKDSLSQWRAYGEPTSGYAIGFTGTLLRDVATKHDFYLARCIYEPPAQRGLIRALLEEVLEENIEREETGKTRDYVPPGGNLGEYLHRYAPILKDPSFAEEREWRLISRPMNCTHEGFDYRPGHSMVVPFYRLPLSADDIEFRVHEVVVGPTPHPRQSIQSVQSLLVSEGVPGAAGASSRVRISASIVPYRSW